MKQIYIKISAKYLNSVMLILLAVVTLSAQTPTPNAGIDESKSAEASKLFDEAFTLFRQHTAKSYQAASLKFQAAAELFAQTGEKLKQAVSLLGMGTIADNLGDESAALKNYQAALPIFRQIKDKQYEAVTLNNIGTIYDISGEKQKALDFYNQSLLLRREVKDKAGETVSLTNIGKVYSDLGEKQKALEYFNQLLPILRDSGDKSKEAVILNNIGKVYSDLGEKQKALDYYNQSLILRRAISDKAGEATTLNNIGAIYDVTGEKRKALDYYNQSLPLRREVGDKAGEAVTLSNIGLIYDSLGEKQKALDYYNQSLIISQNVGDKSAEATVAASIGKVYFDLEEKQKALEYFQRSLSLTKDIADKEGEATALGWLSYYWNLQKNPYFAVFYGKQAINLYQQLRSNITGLDKETQKTYLKSIESNYRQLSNILIEQGRIAEAEQVLAMLKDEEFLSYVRRDDAVAKDLKVIISLSSIEQEAFDNYEKNADQITKIGAEFSRLEKQKNSLPLGESLPSAEQKQYDSLKQKLDDANAVFTKFLEDLKVRFKQTDVRVAAIESDTQGILKRLNEPHTVIISTIVGEDKLNLIVTTADTQRAHTVEIKSSVINKLVTDFRAAVKNPQVDPRPLGKKLFDVLFPADLQKDLDNIQADTIVWSLDGTLRYIPMPALWDGKDYLVERYTNAVLTLASRDKISEAIGDRTKWQALGVGVSKETSIVNADGTKINFPALSAVPQELCSIISDPQKKEFCLTSGVKQTGILTGLMLPDDEFTLAGFQNYLGRTPVVHIASHFSLNAGNEADSFLLLGGGAERRFSLATLRKTRLDRVELLVLSACNTAMTSGDSSRGVEVEGFGALAQNQGAKTVLATLWSVADDSTRDLMTGFYKNLETTLQIGKAEALRKAQLMLLHNETKMVNETKRAEIVGAKNEAQEGQPKYEFDPKKPFAHPYYWSPFVLFGNWR